MNEVLLTPEEVGDVLRVQRSTVYGLIRRGELASIKVGPRNRRIRRAAVDEYIAGLVRDQNPGTSTTPAPTTAQAAMTTQQPVRSADLTPHAADVA